MSDSAFDWSKYQKNTQEEEAESSPNSFDWTPYKSIPIPEKKMANNPILEGIKGSGRLAARAASSLISAPAKGLGGLLELFLNLTMEDPEFNIGKFIKEAGEGGDAQIKSLIEKYMGESYGSGEEALTKFAERAANFYGMGPFKGMGVPSVLAGAGGQVAEQLGVGPEGQLLAEVISSGGKEIPGALKSLVPTQVVEKSGLILPRIVDKLKSGNRFFKPRVFSGSKEKVYKDVSDQAQELINKIKLESLPLSEQIEKGIDVAAEVNNNLNSVERIASKLDYQVESNFISDYLKNAKEKINKSPVPSQEQNQILKLIEEFEEKYGAIGDGFRFYTPQEYVNQFRTINKDMTQLYETQFFQGKKLDTIGFYEGLKKEIGKTLDHGTPESFSKLFKSTNEQFSQLQKINSFETAMQSVIKDGVIDSNKLSSIFKSPSKSKMLRKQLGKEGFDRLRLISQDLSKAEKNLNLIKDIDLKHIVKSGAVAGLLSKLGIKGLLPLQGVHKGSELSYGYFLLNPKATRDFDNFLKAVQSGNKDAMITYIKRMDGNALKEESS